MFETELAEPEVLASETDEPEVIVSSDATTEGEAEEDVITLGGESPSQEETETETETASAPAWVRELRKNHREISRENKELKEKLSAKVSEPKPEPLGAKPTLSSNDYDSDKYEEALEAWHTRKQATDDALAKQNEEQKAVQAAQKAKGDAYNLAKSKLKAPDYEDAEATAAEVFSPMQQAIIVNYAKTPAHLIYALGRNPKRARELAALKDAAAFTYAIATLEATDLKITKKTAPEPERRISGTAKTGGSTDAKLERLRADALKTGNATALTAYKRELRNK